MELLEIRKNIDAVDDEILRLFLKRMELSREVAEEKIRKNIPILNMKREREVLSRISEKAGDMDGYARILYSTLFELSRSYQGSCLGKPSPVSEKIQEALANTPKLFPVKAVVACQGIEGANSQQACDRMFSFADIMYFKNFEGVFNAVEKGLCEYGVLPIENSAHGSVNDVYDLMQGHSFNIVRSIKQHISHNLLVRPGTKECDIKEIISHPQALGQCSSYINSLENAKSVYAENTAIAAELVAKSGRSDIAAISSEECADMYGLEVLKRGIQNTDNNYTRFIAISKKLEIYPGSGKISLMFTASDTPGSLARVMSRFASIGVNLSKIESRPMSGADFKYVFYTDLDASVYSDEVLKLLSELERELKFFVFLGSYQEIV